MSNEIKRTTLCFVFDFSKQALLMIHKKRGQGAGKWNFPGGKIAQGENPLDAAIRECIEETGIKPVTPLLKGILEFYFPQGNSWNNICSVFSTDQFEGTIVSESLECSAAWIPIDKIPYEQMWDDDRRWVPILMAGKPFHRIYEFDEKDHLICEKILDPTAE